MTASLLWDALGWADHGELQESCSGLLRAGDGLATREA